MPQELRTLKSIFPFENTCRTNSRGTVRSNRQDMLDFAQNLKHEQLTRLHGSLTLVIRVTNANVEKTIVNC